MFSSSLVVTFAIETNKEKKNTSKASFYATSVSRAQMIATAALIKHLRSNFFLFLFFYSRRNFFFPIIFFLCLACFVLAEEAPKKEANRLKAREEKRRKKYAALASWGKRILYVFCAAGF